MLAGYRSSMLALAVYSAITASVCLMWSQTVGDDLAQGISAAAARDFTSAEQHFRKAIAHHPQNARAHKLLGLLYATEERYQEAEEPFKRACQLSPRDEESWYNLGRLYYNLNRWDDSLVTFKHAFARGNSSSRLHAGMALTLEALGRISEAKGQFHLSLQRAGEKELQQYGNFLLRQGMLAESIPVFKRAGDLAGVQRAQRALKASGPTRTPHGPIESVRFRFSELPMVVSNGARGDKHQIETMLAGVAVFDYDNDGWPDIFIANGALVLSLKKVGPEYWNRLYRNNHDGTFTDVTEQAGLTGDGYSMGVAAADFDNDGWTDLFVTGVRGNKLYRNRGDGRFEDVTAQAGLAGDKNWSIAAGWFDYDNDGLLDLFVVRYVDWDPTKEPNCGDPRPGYRTYCHPRLYAPLSNLLYHNEGNGKFRDVSVPSGIANYPGKGMGLAFADYDNDGKLDVFVANDTVPSFLFHNLGNGRFEEVASEAGVAYNGDGRAVSAMGVDFRDYDNDGLEDLFITALSNETFSLFRNLGESKFGETTQSSGIGWRSLPLSGWSTGSYDFNNDGFKDLFVANGHADDNVELTTNLKSAQSNVVFVNRGNGTFDHSLLPGVALHRGAAFGDLNRDGRVDIVVTRLNQKPLILWNDSSSANHWLEFRLHGHHSNRDGIGARLHVVSGGMSQWNRVTSSVGYASSSETVAHFGLGSRLQAERVEIQWPSGIVQVLTNVAADRRLTVEEPAAPNDETEGATRPN